MSSASFARTDEIVVVGGEQGVAVIEAGVLRTIDAMPTERLGVRGPLLYRVLHQVLGAPSGVAVYDEFGIRSWVRGDGEIEARLDGEPAAVGDGARRAVASLAPPGDLAIRTVAAITEPLLRGLEIGFETNPSRVAQSRQLAMFAAAGVTPERLWATAEPLPARALGARFEVQPPVRWEAGSTLAIPCTVVNDGRAIYVSAPPNPVQLCYRWFDGKQRPVGAGSWIHTPLPRSLPPSESVETSLSVKAPDVPGRYVLAVTLLQEDVAWFDDVDPRFGVRVPVVVGTSAP